jgi:hypothetical protein
MIVGVVGSRTGVSKQKVFETLDNEMFIELIITGGAPGVDSFAEEWAAKKRIKCIVIRPINPSNKLDYLFRNVEIISMSDKVIAFWNGASRGTKFVIDYAKARLKDLEIVT